MSQVSANPRRNQHVLLWLHGIVMRTDASIWLLIGAISLALVASIVPISATSASWVFFLGVTAGCISALGYANDRRVLKGRPVSDEHGWLSAAAFLAIGGVLQVVVSWLLLPPMYFWFVGRRIAGSALTWASLVGDVRTAFTAPAMIGMVELPLGFVWAGFLTLLATWAYLNVLGSKGAAYFAALTPLVYGTDVLVADHVFHDPISDVERWVLFPTLLGIFVLLGWLRSREQLGERVTKRESARVRRLGGSVAWSRDIVVSLVVVAAMTATDVVTRGVAHGIGDPTHRPFVLLAYRPAYFSLFLGYVLVWWFFLRKPGARNEPSSKAWGLALVTALIFGCAYFLRIVATGDNLAVGPLAISATVLVFLPLVGAWYGTDGGIARLRQRLAEVYDLPWGGQTVPGPRQSAPGWRERWIRFVAYLALICVMFAWALVKLGWV